MKKRALSILLVLCMVMMLLPTTAWANEGTRNNLVEEENKGDGTNTRNFDLDESKFEYGDGTQENPFHIQTFEQLNAIRENLNAHYIQTSDIDLSGIEWSPIGQMGAATDAVGSEFSGSYDGNGYKISNLTISKFDSDNVCIGLFGVSNGIIKNITLENCHISIDVSAGYVGFGGRHNTRVGSVTGYSRSLIDNCTVSGKIDVQNVLSAQIGGVVGSGDICENSLSSTEIFINGTEYGSSSGVVQCGGIAGYIYYVNNCINYGNITASADSFLQCGGISGENGKLDSCTNYGNISGKVLNYKSYSSFGGNCNVGGIVGLTNSTKNNNCTNYGDISSTKNDKGARCYSGGVAGYLGSYNQGNISNCYNYGKRIVADDNCAGRVVGILWTDNATNLYSSSKTLVNGSIPTEDIGLDKRNGANIEETDAPESTDSVYFLSGWDAATRTVQFGDNTLSTPITYTVADGVDVSNIDSLLNKYVLVTMEQGGSSLEYTITDIQPVESKFGTVSATGEHSLTIDGTTYPVREDYVLALYDGNEVLYHVYNGTIMGCDVLEEKTGTIEVWNGATGNITIDGTVYSTNYLSDLSFVSNIENYLNKQYYFITVKTGNYTLLYKISERYYPGGKLEDFNADIYHATWLSKHGNAADMLEDKTPSEILIDVVSDGHGDLAMDMWRSLNLVFETLDDVDNLREFAVEPRDLYSALILEALEASASCDVVASEYEEALGIFKRCISDFSTFVKMDTGIDLNNSDEFQDIVSRMPGVDVDAYTEKFIQDWYKTNYPNIADISKSLGYISKGLKVVGTLEDFTEYCAQCITLMRVSDSMKYVLELACLKSAEIYGPTDNMTQAFNDCLQMITRSSDELFDQIEKKAVSVVGWAGYKYLVSEVLWKEVSKQIQIACPEIAILKLIYKAENTICNKLFKTEDAAEKYLKMDGIVNIESIINTVYRDLEFAFDRTPTLEGAKRYLSAMELSFRLRNVDCKTSNEYVENIQSSLVGSIKELLGAADYESLKQCINSIQSEYATHYTLAETGWVPYLEEDYPGSGLYELYSALYETILDSGADVKLIKQITAACPVNVYIYDQQDNIVASIVESRVSCSVNDVMIALLGEEKIIRFYNGADYHIEYVGYDIGEMDVTITEFDENEKTTRTVNYYDLKLTEGKTYAVDANNETLKPYDLLDKSNNSTVQHDYDSMDTNNSHALKIISGTLQQGGELFTETIASKGETLQIDAYVSEGDEFVRWEASSVNALIADTTSTNTTLIMPDEDLIVTAIMRETSSPSTLHTVTFNPNGGTVDVSIAVTASNGKLSTLPIPILAGHAFDGWYTASSGGEKITTDYVFTSDTTVYAHWTKNSGGSSGGSSSDGNSSGGGSSSASYSITTGNFAHGSVSVSPKSASKGTKVTITATPDTGYKLEKLAVTGNTGNELELTNKGDGTYTFIMPAGTVKVEASFVAIETAEAPWVNPFTDVAENAWYYNAVRFVSENGLMGGYGNGLFGVNDNLSRAQLAQILYNKEGKPLVNDGNGFSDVDTGAWYANAVTWAAANGIVSGYGNGMFGPNNPITREQLAVMLWRYSGSPAATNKELHFNDAEEISGYALEALSWAVENGILNGYGDGRLGPQGQATRAQVAQMLKNYLER